MKTLSLFFCFLLSASLVGSLTSCYSARTSGKKHVTAAGLKVPKRGYSIDAHYDDRLDVLIPGYRLLTVALTNRSYEVLRLDALKDRWVIEDARGRKHKAINSLRIKNPKLWAKLPPKVQHLVDYPKGVGMGYTETFDVFFPKGTDLKGFRSVSFYSSDKRERYDIIAIDRDDPRHQPAESEYRVPANFPPEYHEKYGKPGSKPKPTSRPIPTQGTFKRIK